MMEIDEIEQMLKERFKIYDEVNVLYSKGYDYLIRELSQGENITENAYKFLCWLYQNNPTKFPTPIDKPFVPEPIKISKDDFKKKFCTNDKRNILFNWFIDYLNARMEEFKLDCIDVLIGGSFVDEYNESPNDIDCAILIDEIIMTKFIEKNYDSYNPRQHIKVDAEYIIKNRNVKDFWNYSCLTHLGNKPHDKVSVLLKNNVFTRINVFQLNLCPL